MSLPIKSAVIHARISKAFKEQEVEMPTQVFNKMCFGFVNNDWMTVISSMLKLSAFVVVMCFSRSV
jgi:hypothetical protein